jgi:hypothetical protein
MTSCKKVCSTLMMALWVTMGGAAFATASVPLAASPVTTTFSDTVAPSQSQDKPADCKKTPDDPRCKNKPY